MSTEQSAPRGYRVGDCVAGHLWVEALLGHGGAGAVYRVRDERKGGRLALKQLRAPDNEHKALLTSQFAREYHMLAQLSHPRIIEVYDYGVDGACPYYTMELLDGEDLHDRGKQPFRAASALLCDVASSLAILHSRGLIHRDVSARNVRCTSDGRAKLIDFGAVVPAGSVHRAIGTPPFAAPEILQMQALDARADLYSLGALAYWTLTGRHAFAAQTFNQLRDLWRRTPRKLTELAPDVPEALAELVMSLLRLDRDERPRSAAEVMERLCGIAGLQRQELPQVGRAYLNTPSLVGRDAVLQEARTALLRTMQASRGAALLIEGPKGVGRSRFLDACVLEAKLVGAVVLRAAPTDAAQGEYGVLRSLLEQLVEACPDLCEQAAQPRAALLVHVLPALAAHVVAAETPERRHLQAAIRDFFLAITRTRHIVVAVDEVGEIDEPSAALLCALAHGTQRRRLTLLLTARSDPNAPHAVDVLREIAQRLALQALDTSQTEALLRSLFGDHPGIATLSARLYGLSFGNPRELMALAEHLVSQGVLRYESGSWALPFEILDRDLPKSDRAALEARIALLSADARDLAEALSLTQLSALSLEHYARLTQHGDTGRTFRALDELSQAGILVDETGRYRLASANALAPLAESLTPERAQTLHARLASVLPQDRHSAARLIHMLRGGQEQAAIAELLAGPPDDLYAGRIDALVLAAEAAARLKLPVLTTLELHYRIARLSAPLTRPDLFDAYGWPLIERLRRDSGWLDYREQGANAQEADRYDESLRRAQQRYDALGPNERGFPPREAMLRLVAMYGSCGAIAGTAQDLHQVERLGTLEPFLHLSPAIRLVQLTVDSACASQAQRVRVASRQWSEILRRLDEPGAVNPATARLMRLGVAGALAGARAMAADPSCETWIELLDAEPGYRGNAWRFRMVYRLASGDAERAEEYERRAVLFDLQDAGNLTYQGGFVQVRVILHGLMDDLTEVKRARDQLRSWSRIFPRWQVIEAIANAEIRRLQGDTQGALAALRPALDAVSAGRHPLWTTTCRIHVRLLMLSGSTQDAARIGLGYVNECARLDILDAALKALVAEVLAEDGRSEDAARLADEAIAAVHADHSRGIWLAASYEARARVAIAMQDASTFKACIERVGEVYLRGRSPGLRARYERLLNAAVGAGLIAPARPSVPDDLGTQRAENDEARTVYSRMLTCISPLERAERALQLLLEATGAHTGYFYGLRSGKLSLLFNPEQTPPAAALAETLEDCLKHELGNLTTPPAASAVAPAGRTSASPQAIAAPLARYIDDLGREFQPLLLAGTHAGEAMIAGVAALHYADDERPPPRRAMLDAVIEALISDDVVDPITCVT